MRDYCWCDNGGCPPNFEHFATGVKARWYKHPSRGFEWIVPPTDREQVIEILLDCMKPLVKKLPSLPRNDLNHSSARSLAIH